MANKRQLKKGINAVCNQLIDEVVAFTICEKSTIPETTNQLFANILTLQDDMLSRISHIEPGLSPKIYFKKLRADMAKGVEDILEQIKVQL